METATMNPEQRKAYQLGKAAARRGSDLDAAEARYLRRHGHQQVDAWLAGWTDQATA